MSELKKTGFEALAKESTLYPQEALVKVKANKHSFFLGLPKEISLQESRITLTPEAVALLVINGHQVRVESGAGLKSKFTDNEYSEAGAEIVNSANEVYDASVILKIEPPTDKEIELLKPGKTLISALQIGDKDAKYINNLLSKGITALGYEYLEDKVGGFPIIRAMSEIAGSTSIQIAAEYLSSVRGGRGTILGGISGVPPTKLVILGAGTVAEYAARAASGMGAEVRIFDNHIYKLRRIKHALGHLVYTSTIDTVVLAETLKTCDVLIGAIRSEKGKNRIIISEEMVMGMKPDSIIIDISIDQGGCVETSKMTTLKDPIYRLHDVIHYCVPNIASRVARTATTALSNIFTPTILRAGEAGGLDEMIFGHHWFMKGVYAYKGSLTNAHIAEKFAIKCKDLNLLMAARF